MYRKIRRYNSDIHIYEFNPRKHRISNDFGVKGKLEPLSRIGNPKPGEKVAAKINATFFGGKSEHDGPYIQNGDWYGTTSETYLGVVFTKKYELIIEKITDAARAAYWQGNAFWVVGGSFILTVDGRVNLTNITPFPHWKNEEPRTAIGQKIDGNIVLVVIDGRSSTNAGVTGKELAEIMLELGCINSINLDGGGSSEMIVENSIKNKPSDGLERAIGAALVVYRPWVIALDDGHGMETAGKRTPVFIDGTKSLDTGKNLMHENEFNRAVVDMLDKRFREHGFNTVLTAPGDTDISLEDRVDKANNKISNGYGHPIDFFLSIHANAWGDGTWNDVGGQETYVISFGGQAEKAARIIHKHLLKGTQLKDRGVKTANYYVLKHTWMSAILFELAFMTNQKEAKLLMSDEYRHECVEEIMAGFCEYLGVQYIAAPIAEPINPPNPPEQKNEIDYKMILKDLQNIIDKYK